MIPRPHPSCHAKQGAAIVELAMAMLLMMSMLLFILFIGRFLSDRNRVLAASRTVAWLHAHQQLHNGQPMEGSTRIEDMHMLVRHWHFRESRYGGGVVSLKNSHRMGTGIMYQGAPVPGEMEGAVDNLLTENNQSDEVGFGGADTGDGSTAADMVAKLMEAMKNAFLSLVGQDFAYHEVQVGYAMPMVFPLGHQFFFGRGVDGLQDISQDDSAYVEQAQPGQVYASLNRAHTGRCVFPDLNASTENALDELAGQLEEIRKLLQGFMEENEPLYRPRIEADREELGEEWTLEPGDTAEQLEALLIYEIVGYDPNHEHARGDGGDPWW